MKQVENKDFFVDLNSEEMADLNGGSKAVELALYYAGKLLGALAKSQERLGDTGQWLA
jgi:hypothetical protein